MAAFRGMHVSPAKHSYAWLPRKCDNRTDTHTNTDGRTDRRKTKWSLCAAMLRRRHNKWGEIKSCYDSAHICPIRAEISTHEHWENVFILYFVWLGVIGFRHNYFRILPNFGDFGAKMSFFRYIINQKQKIFIKHCPPSCSKTPLISEMCIYITNNLCKWRLGTRGGGGGGTMFYRQKIGEGQLITHEIPL